MDFINVKGEKWQLVYMDELPTTLQTRYRFSNGTKTVDFLVDISLYSSERELRKRCHDLILQEVE